MTNRKPIKLKYLNSRPTYYLLAFIFPILIMGLILYVTQLYPFSDDFATSGDFATQYQPLYFALKEVLTSGDWMGLYWSFQKGLGGAMTSVFGFNSLSPITVGLALTPAAWFVPVYAGLSLIRYGLASMAFFHYLWVRKRSKDDTKPYTSLALLYSVIYGLSGYMVVNHYNPNFLDNLLYFPLLMIGLEKILDGQQSKSYPWVLALMILTQFYIAYMAALAVAIYAIYYLIGSDQTFGQAIDKIVRLVKYSLLGVGLTAFWLMPLFFNLLASKAKADALFSLDFDLLYPIQGLVTKFLPMVNSFEEWGDNGAMPQVYVTGIVILTFIQLFISPSVNRRQKLGVLFLLLVYLISFQVTIVDSIWHMGQRPVGFYFRNAWAFSFAILSLSYTSWQASWGLSLKQALWTLIMPALAVIAYLTIDYYALSDQAFYLGISLWILLIGLLVQASRPWAMVLIALLTLGELGLNTYQAIDSVPYYNSREGIEEKIDLYQAKVIPQLQDPEVFYRADLNLSGLNTNLFAGVRPVGHFTSSIEYSLIDTFGKLGLPSSKAMVNYQSLPLTDALFSVKYSAQPDPLPPYLQDMTSDWIQVGDFNQWNTLYENPYRLGLGFLVSESFINLQLEEDQPILNQDRIMDQLFDSSQSYFQLLMTPSPLTSNLNLDNSVYEVRDQSQPTFLSYSWTDLDPEASYYLQIPKHLTYYLPFADVFLNRTPYELMDRFTSPQLWPVQVSQQGTIELSILSNSVEKYDMSELRLVKFMKNEFQQAILEKQADNLELQKVTNREILASVEVTNPDKQWVFLSIPYNQGWKLEVDGQTILTQPVWQTFTGFELSPGHHDLKFIYRPPGILPGILVSCSSLVILLWMYFTQTKEEELLI